MTCRDKQNSLESCSKKNNIAFDKDAKTEIFRKLFHEVPEARSVECWTEIVNVLNKYKEQAN